MKPFLAVAALVSTVLLAGCQTSEKLNQIQIGMTRDQVVAILGTPDSKSAQANMEYYTYYLTNDANYGRDQPYMIRFVDGRVESFGRMLQLFDAYNRPVAGSPQGGAPGMTMMPGSAGSGPTIMPTMGAGPSQPTVVRVNSIDLATELERLKALKDKGVLTDEEFQRVKDRMIGAAPSPASPAPSAPATN